jgi:hypothetical protein
MRKSSSTVPTETWSWWATSSAVKPPKKRSVTTWLCTRLARLEGRQPPPGSIAGIPVEVLRTVPKYTGTADIEAYIAATAAGDVAEGETFASFRARLRAQEKMQ